MAEPFSLTQWLQDPNNISLLAGIGSRLDPKGIGGALGQPVIDYQQALAAQKAGAKVAAQPAEPLRRYRDVQERLGGDFTPKGTPGPTSLAVNKDGSYAIEGDLHPSEPQSAPTEADLGTTLTPTLRVPRVPRYRPSLGEAPTQEQIDNLVYYPYPKVATATPSAPAVAQAPSADVAAAPSAPALGLTAQDLRGLTPAQVNQLIGQSIDASQLEAQVLGLAGRDITTTRAHQARLAAQEAAARRTDATALSAAKTKAAETIASSNLTPEQQREYFQRLDAATSLDQARAELVNASKLPPLVHSAQERDDLARELFGTRTYAQLDQAQQAQVNARLLKEKADWTIVTTDQGIFRINRKTGEGPYQVHGPTTTGAPGTITTGPSATATPEEVAGIVNQLKGRSREEQLKVIDSLPPDMKGRVQEGLGAPSAGKPLAYEQLSPFARSVSHPSALNPPAFGAKAPTEGQSRAQAFGSQALNANEIIRDLEQNRGEFGSGIGMTLREKLRHMTPAEAASVGGVVGGLSGPAIPGLGPFGAIAGRAVGAVAGGGLGYAIQLATPLLGYLDSPVQRAYLQAKANFIGAVLRKESGAAISADEFRKEDARYFPQMGDSPETIANKARAREGTIQGLQRESGKMLQVPQVVPSQESNVQPGMGITQEVLKKITTPAQSAPAPGSLEGVGQEVLDARRQALPVAPQEQVKSAPRVVPKADLPVDTLHRLMRMREMGSVDIAQGRADEMLKAIGPETMAQQMSYYGIAQRAAIRGRFKTFGTPLPK